MGKTEYHFGARYTGDKESNSSSSPDLVVKAASPNDPVPGAKSALSPAVIQMLME
ncbi:hypothetical protein EC912_101376 [Luteibacter rhizovicinus]|uniref:Uncharacterized protein n=1 Tax=Luteibacter rhizovicinus TaxID=242606 RepID=A0A4R3YWA1_9GAMM|nr:hypothetical protein [Luteibacter rhizovicinus]TCV97367.1 hypothetical protein EC912_101376 [Luteibacter rhizovicinus]